MNNIKQSYISERCFTMENLQESALRGLSDYDDIQLISALKNAFEKGGTGEFIPTELLKNEQWREYKNLQLIKSWHIKKDIRNEKFFGIESMLISNYGRIKIKKVNSDYVFAQQEIIESGCKLKDFSVCEYSFPPVHILVAETWSGFENTIGKVVHHINNRGYDNRIENLIYLTNEEHGTVHHPKII